MDPISARMVMAAAGAGAAGSALLVEDVFSTFLYEGNASNRTITNGIDLSGEGGMVWLKNRTDAFDHYVFDTERALTDAIFPSTNNAEAATGAELTSWNNDGFGINSNGVINGSGDDQASWTFRKAPGFFDVVTYTGDGTVGRTISHNLGSAPGMIWVKNTTNNESWAVYHRSRGATEYGELDNSNSFTTGSTVWNDTEPTSTEFTVGTKNGTNASGDSFVAYLFAHDDARFGPNANESIIKCGTYAGNGSTTGPVIDLGWEPQWVLTKRTNAAGQWVMFDTARGTTYDGDATRLYADATSPESGFGANIAVLQNGFKIATNASDINASASTYIYMAIRRPDKAPTTASDFFQVRTRGGTSSDIQIPIDFNADNMLVKNRGASSDWMMHTRGFADFRIIRTNEPDALLGASTSYASVRGDEDSTVKYGTSSTVNAGGNTYVDYFWKRARGAFDVVYYTGNSTNRTISHGLQSAPQMMWVKRLDAATNWGVYANPIGAGNILTLNNTGVSSAASSYWNSTDPTDQVFSLGTSSVINNNNSPHVAYLFGNVSGLVDIGSYTGTGVAGLQVDCGFTAGARFVLIKRTTGGAASWSVFDTARGIVAGAEPILNIDTGAQESSFDYIDPYSPGFEIALAGGALNSLGDTFIYMAIA